MLKKGFLSILFTCMVLTSACGRTPVAPATPPPPQEVELKYDDGISDGSASAGGYSFRVQFAPPAIPFTINKIRMFTSLVGSEYETQKVEVAILSKDLSLLYSFRKAATEFSQVPSWMTIEIPSVQVNNDFYVYVYPNSKREGGVYIHYDLSTINQHSEYMTPSGEVAPWTGTSPKERTNWMIRVVGTTK